MLCRQTSHFWNKVAEWLKKLNLLPRYYTLTNITALDLRPDSSRFWSVTHCFLWARYHKWFAKTREDHPNLTHFRCTLKSQCKIEIKMETFCTIYGGFINILDCILAITVCICILPICLFGISGQVHNPFYLFCSSCLWSGFASCSTTSRCNDNYLFFSFNFFTPYRYCIC